ncbi:sensor histidine kinase [Cognatiluteimonas profundi]|uniref:sensor histidine kinase n=1 Tax=Cognatiluteimonas profundi TaxID=2594501 RepID=UPI00131B8C61|nr:PAS domain-containing sensor histidine kinase [Lysobacter profundi]
MDRLLQDIINMLPVGVWVADAQGHLVRNNPAAERIWLGADLVGIDELDRYKGWWVDTGKPITLEEWGLVRAIRHGETTVGQLVRIQCFDGSFKIILASAAPLYDDSGRLTGAVAINEDVTALQEGEQRWRHREQLLHTMFDLLPVGVWALDAIGNVTLVNPAAERIWGRHDWKTLADFSASKGWRAGSDEPIAPGDWAVSRALREGVTSREELIRIEAMDGSQRTIINWAAPIVGESGEVTGAIAVNEDVTPLYRAQEQLRAAVRDREEILAIVAHDLRNPLGSIMLGASTAQSMASKLPGGENLRDRMAVLVDLARNMSGLVEDLLAIGVSTTGGKPMLELRQVAPSTLVKQAFDTACPLYAQHGVELRCEIEPGLSDIRVDARRIERVLANLLDNALKYTEPPCVVTLSAQAHGPVVFSVTNSGPALTTEQRDAMFQPFWQAEQRHRGAGLGLSICRSIVEAHGGSIWAEAAEGQRVRVSFHVPRLPAALVPLQPAPTGVAAS